MPQSSLRKNVSVETAMESMGLSQKWNAAYHAQEMPA